MATEQKGIEERQRLEQVLRDIRDGQVLGTAPLDQVRAGVALCILAERPGVSVGTIMASTGAGGRAFREIIRASRNRT